MSDEGARHAEISVDTAYTHTLMQYTPSTFRATSLVMGLDGAISDDAISDGEAECRLSRRRHDRHGGTARWERHHHGIRETDDAACRQGVSERALTRQAPRLGFRAT